MSSIPVIDIQSLVKNGVDAAGASEELGAACRDHGFFYVSGHGVAEELQRNLEALSRRFFALDKPTKMRIRMELGGRAWRGYFPLGQELTSGKPDLKEGLYFGTELGPEHELVRANTPLHGANLFPDLAGFRETVLEYMRCLTEVGHALMRGICMSLGLKSEYFHKHYTHDPLILFRIFNYPATSPEQAAESWGVGEHTDYGILTILRQDEVGGLQVKSQGEWIEAPPLPGTFVCNIGDMLDRMTGGRYRSTPHRVRNVANRDRLSFPFFFDPNFEARVAPLPGCEALVGEATTRWDGQDVHAFDGNYGDYVLSKVAKVFPDLAADHGPESEADQ